jgi:hypothetical protein
MNLGDEVGSEGHLSSGIDHRGTSSGRQVFRVSGVRPGLASTLLPPLAPFMPS